MISYACLVFSPRPPSLTSVLPAQNICASDLDTAEPDQRARDRGLENFTDHPPRKWLGEFTDHGGKDGVTIDITRYLHPERHGMYTCA